MSGLKAVVWRNEAWDREIRALSNRSRGRFGIPIHALPKFETSATGITADGQYKMQRARL